MFKVAILSFWHVHAEDYARQAEANPETEIVAVWDESPKRGRAEAGKHRVDFHADLDELLRRPDVDGVVVTTPTTAHRDVIPAAAKAGKHVFSEKVISPSLREAEEIVVAAEDAGVTFVISLPRLYAGYARAIKETIESGLLGQITYLRVRVSHDGALRTAQHPDGWLPSHFFDTEQSAGGVMIDFGAHPLYLVAHLLGLPEEISANYSHATGRKVEDNAVVTMRYGSGAIAVAEASFVGAASPFFIEAHGTEGSLVFGGPNESVYLRSTSTGKAGWEAISLPPDAPSPFDQWVSHAAEGSSMPENIRAALQLNALAEAANLSAREARPVRPYSPRLTY
ncbi:MAG TPA: Gfo/Idh/MocA family oxidoreductase [Rubrobacteraceae bacterium]|nr:Gfo/Idh/MocA family oxidoreductase [Rubrobacteraceae bacterium]